MTTLVNLAYRPLVTRTTRIIKPVYETLAFLAPVSDLLVRLWVANVFFKSGLTKFQSWDSTVLLFTYEYQVPFLSPATAALLGTAAELILPVLLALGLAGRLSAAALFVFNIIAVISYPDLMEAGLRDHQLWGILLLITLTHGPGKLSLDYMIGKYTQR